MKTVIVGQTGRGMSRYTTKIINAFNKIYDTKWYKFEHSELFMQQCSICGKSKQCEYIQGGHRVACKECVVVESI